MWLHELKIAIVEKDINKLNLLLDDIPQLEKPEETDSALCLLEEASTIVLDLKESTAASMAQMKKNINFLESTQAPSANKFDIKS